MSYASLEGIDVCCLSIKKERKMSRSKYNNRKQSSLFAEECLISSKKNLRQPLKCKKNVIDTNRCLRRSPRVSCSVKIDELSKTPKQNMPKKHRSSCSAKIDVLSKVCETVSQKSPERALRSSSRHKVTLLSKEVIEADKIPERKSKRQQNVLDKKTSVSQTIALESSNKSKRPSFYRHSFPSQCSQKSKGPNELCSNSMTGILTGPQDSRIETVRSSRHSMKLRLQELSEKNSDNVQLPTALKTKHVRSSTQKKQEQMTKLTRRSSKRLSSDQFLKNTPTVKQNKCVKKSEKLQKRVRSKSYIGNIPIDVLALSTFPTRKTKSDGFKFPSRNTLKRKRFITDAMRKADENYEDDIFSGEKKFDNFKQLFPDSSESDMSSVATTPKLGFELTPVIHGKTPMYKDCYSPTEYILSRKIAEECFYRNKKRKSNSKLEIPEVPEKKKLEFNQVLEEACKVQKEVEKITADISDNEDSYFSDCEI